MPSRPPVTAVPRRTLAAGLAAGLAARPARAAASSIALAAAGDWLQDSFQDAVLAPFRKARPDIDVLFYGAANPSQILATLRNERGLPTLDVVLLDAVGTARATVEGLLDPLDPAALPPAPGAAPGADPGERAAPFAMWDSLAIGYNPALVPGPPRTWRDLWNPRFTRIAVQTPPDPLALGLTAVACALFGGRTDDQSLGAGFNALSALAPRIAARDPRPDIYAAITQGEAAIGPVWNARGRLAAARSQGRLAVVLPEEGSPAVPTTVNLVKGSRRRDAAMALINYLLGPVAQRQMAEALSFAPALRTDLPEAALARVGATAAQESRRMPIAWLLAPALRDRIAVEWRARNLSIR